MLNFGCDAKLRESLDARFRSSRVHGRRRCLWAYVRRVFTVCWRRLQDSSALSDYTVEIPSPCHQGTNGIPVERDLRVGETVRVTVHDVFANACGPTVPVRVVYEKNRNRFPTRPARNHRRANIDIGPLSFSLAVRSASRLPLGSP